MYLKGATIYVEGMTLRQISEKYDVPLDTVTHRYSRGIHDLDGLTSTEFLKNNKHRLNIAYGNGKRFLEESIDRNINLDELSRRTGISRSAIWNFIYNRGDISSVRLAKLCGVVGCSMDYVMGLKN